MIRLAALALPLLLAAPAMAQTPPPQRLVLNLADRDGDGAVSPAEAAERLAIADVRELPTTEPSDWYRRPAPPHEPQGATDGLAMKRRLIPASEFELANEKRFEETLRRIRKENR